MFNLEKIIDLIKKTGDNCVVLDHDGKPAYVIMSFDDYQSLVLNKSEVASLTEDELLRKINRDVATWKATQDADNLDNWPALTQRGKQTIESTIEEVAKPSSEVFNDEKSLNGANIENDSESDKNGQEKYYFEPID